MNEFDWSFFQIRIPVTASKSSIFELWNSSSGLESWFLRSATAYDTDGHEKPKAASFLAGDNYAWYWHGWDDKVVEKGIILANNHVDSIQFSFGKAGNVKVDIKEEGKYTIIELTQDEIPLDEKGRAYYHLGCKTGWTFHLTNLKSILEGGHDLRNRDIDLKNVINS